MIQLSIYFANYPKVYLTEQLQRSVMQLPARRRKKVTHKKKKQKKIMQK